MNAIPVCAWHSAGRRSMRAWLRALLAVTMLAAVAVGSAAGQSVDDELPGRVGRIADVGGQLFYSPPDQPTAWASIDINYPVTTGDNLWLSGDGRVEVDYGGGQFRLAGDTNLHVSRLDDRQIALFVAQGRVIVRLRYLEPGEIATIDTPNTQVQLMRPGLYRVDVFPDLQQTSAIVREGEALVAIVNGAQQVLPGQVASVRGSSPDAAYVQSGVGTDGFDAWSADRDRHYERSRASAYVSRQMIGWSDLDAYGSWQTYPEYGPVWFPTTVAADWAPFRDGYWTSVGGWGWTWVDSAPWGFAPSHYGRWVSFGGRWGWCPGGFVSRPVWAPAMVAWFGGAGWGISTTIGSPVYGWVPLGWRDPVRPWWGHGRCGDRCWTHFNQPFGVNQADFRRDAPVHFSNFRVPGAVTAVPGATMMQRRPVFRNRVEVPPSAIAAAPPIAEAPAFRPAWTPTTRPGGNVPPPATSLMRPGRPSVVPIDAAARPPAGIGTSSGETAGRGAAAPPRAGTGGGAPPQGRPPREQPPSGAAVPAPAPAVVPAPVAPSGSAAPSRPRETGGAVGGRDRGQGPTEQGQPREGRGAAGTVAAPPAVVPAPAVPAPGASAPAPRGRAPAVAVPPPDTAPVQGRGAASVPATPHVGGQGAAAPTPRAESRQPSPRAPAMAVPPSVSAPPAAAPAATPRHAPVRQEPPAAPIRSERGIAMPPAAVHVAPPAAVPAAPPATAAPPMRAPAPQAGGQAPQAGRGQGANAPAPDKGGDRGGRNAPSAAEPAGGAAAPPPK